MSILFRVVEAVYQVSVTFFAALGFSLCVGLLIGWFLSGLESGHER